MLIKDLGQHLEHRYRQTGSTTTRSDDTNDADDPHIHLSMFVNMLNLPSYSIVFQVKANLEHSCISKCWNGIHPFPTSLAKRDKIFSEDKPCRGLHTSGWSAQLSRGA
jgi:hypothetical protein